MSREEKKDRITVICSRNGCDEKQAAKHMKSYLDADWMPHASRSFDAWWQQHPESETVNVVIAYNTQRYRDLHMEAKQIGLAA